MARVASIRRRCMDDQPRRLLESVGSSSILVTHKKKTYRRVGLPARKCRERVRTGRRTPGGLADEYSPVFYTTVQTSTAENSCSIDEAAHCFFTLSLSLPPSLLIDLLMLRITTLVQVQWHSPEKFIRYPSRSIHMLSSGNNR